MLTKKQNSLLNFLGKHEYLVTVEETEIGCIMSTPERLLDELVSENVYIYEIFNGKDKVGVQFDALYNGISAFIEMPAYAISVAIVCHISKICAELGYGTNMIEYINDKEERVEKFSLASKIGLDEADVEKMGKLQKLTLDIVNKELSHEYDVEAQTDGISDGFNVIKRILNS